MNIVEFALRFKDMASGTLRNFGSQTQQTMAGIGAVTNNLTSRNRILSMSYTALQNRMREVEATIQNSTSTRHIREARRELEQLQRTASRHTGRVGSEGGGGGALGLLGGFRNILGVGAVIGAVRKGTQFISDSIGKGLSRSMINTSFSVVAGSEQAGEGLTSQLVSLQKDTILGSEVFKNAQTMMGFGFDSSEVVKNMRMLGDVSMGSAEKLGSLTLAYSQVRAGGKLTGQDLLQFINAGFNPLEQISKSTGKSMAALKDEMSDGNISFKDVQQAFIDATSEGGRFNRMLEKIAETPAGKVEQLKGAWDEVKVGIGTAFQPLVSLSLDLASRILPVVESVITPLTNGINTITGMIRNVNLETSEWGQYISIIRDLVTEHIFPVFVKVWNVIRDMVVRWVEFIKKSELLRDIFTLIGKITGFVWDMISHLIDAIKWVFDNVVMPIVKTIENVYRFIKGKEKIELTGSTTAIVSTPPEEKKALSSNNNLLQDIARNTEEGKNLSVDTGKVVSGSAPKTTNIHVSKFFDNINLHVPDVNEGFAEMESKLLEMFARILAQGASTQ